MLNFNDFKKLASNKKLNTNEKVGFNDIYRKETEINILPDILDKLNVSGQNKTIMDIGCGCSKPVLMLIEYAREHNHILYLVDSKEMLNNIDDEPFINKLFCEFPLCKEIIKLKEKIDYIVVYSVLHHVVTHSNYIAFLDTIIELLKKGGAKTLIADIPNSTKKKRFLTSTEGIKFHQKWSQLDVIPTVAWNELEKDVIDDGLIFGILQRYRNMGCETYLLEQKDGLPMNKTREDILIKRN